MTTLPKPTRQRPTLPAGIARADAWEDAANRTYRIVATADRQFGHVTLWGDARQHQDGSITEPTVRLQAHFEDGLTPAQARQLAEELITAAAEVQLLAAGTNEGTGS